MRPIARALVVLALVVTPIAAEEDHDTRVELTPGTSGSKLAPRYSPKGSKVALEPVTTDEREGRDHRQGHLQLGPANTRGSGHPLLLARSAAGDAFDLLWVDMNGDGALADDELLRGTPRPARRSMYTSFTAEVRVNHGTTEAPAWEPYPISLWVAVESKATIPPFIRFSRRGFLTGRIAIGDAPHHVVVSDANNDAVYGEGDWWALLPADATAHDISVARKVGDFAWSGTQAFKLELEGTAGRRGRVAPFDPGITPEEDARARDPYWDDKRAERAEHPLVFTHDADAAIEDARERGVSYFLDFETVWCGPCKSMDRWVYTAKSVVAAAEGIVCIKVDGDERKDLKERYKVTSFPTGVLFGADGGEIARFNGYRTAKEMTAFFGKARARK